MEASFFVIKYLFEMATVRDGRSTCTLSTRKLGNKRFVSICSYDVDGVTFQSSERPSKNASLVDVMIKLLEFLEENCDGFHVIDLTRPIYYDVLVAIAWFKCHAKVVVAQGEVLNVAAEEKFSLANGAIQAIGMGLDGEGTGSVLCKMYGDSVASINKAMENVQEGGIAISLLKVC